MDVSCNAHDDDQVTIMWTERGGPPVAAPTAGEGFGGKVTHRSMVAQLGGNLAFDWSEQGVVVTPPMSKSYLSN